MNNHKEKVTSVARVTGENNSANNVLMHLFSITVCFLCCTVILELEVFLQLGNQNPLKGRSRIWKYAEWFTLAFLSSYADSFCKLISLSGPIMKLRRIRAFNVTDLQRVISFSFSLKVGQVSTWIIIRFNTPYFKHLELKLGLFY